MPIDRVGNTREELLAYLNACPFGMTLMVTEPKTEAILIEMAREGLIEDRDGTFQRWPTEAERAEQKAALLRFFGA